MLDGRAQDKGTWPFALGESPFRVRGAGYRDLHEFMDLHLRGGFEGIRHEMEEELAAYHAQVFDAEGWYDIMPLLLASEVCATRCGLRLELFLRKQARVQAERDLGVVQRWVMRLVPARVLAKRMPEFMSQRVDFLSVQALALDSERVAGRILGIPLALAPGFLASSRAYAERMLELSTKGSSVRLEESLADGEVHGVQTVSVSFELGLGKG